MCEVVERVVVTPRQTSDTPPTATPDTGVVGNGATTLVLVADEPGPQKPQKVHRGTRPYSKPQFSTSSLNSCRIPHPPTLRTRPGKGNRSR